MFALQCVAMESLLETKPVMMKTMAIMTAVHLHVTLNSIGLVQVQANFPVNPSVGMERSFLLKHAMIKTQLQTTAVLPTAQ